MGSSLRTFSIAFEEPELDESQYQLQLVRALGTQHEMIRCTSSDIAEVFPEMMWHIETPVLRTAPAPMFLLSRLVHDQRIQGGADRRGGRRILGRLRHLQGGQGPGFLGQADRLETQTAASEETLPLSRGHSKAITRISPILLSRQQRHAFRSVVVAHAKVGAHAQSSAVLFQGSPLGIGQL